MIRSMLRNNLERNFIVLEAAMGGRALNILDEHTVDIILMDLNLPDICGFELIKEIRHKTDIPLLILSGENNEEKKVKTLELGGDDFIEKPCNNDLLIARINAFLRREDATTHEMHGAGHLKPSDKSACIKDWIINTSQYQLVNEEGQSAELSLREFNLLYYLVQHPDRAVSRDELCEAMKEEKYIPTPRAIDVKITRIRKKIGDVPSDPEIIVTIRGVGYMLNKDYLKA